MVRGCAIPTVLKLIMSLDVHLFYCRVVVLRIRRAPHRLVAPCPHAVLHLPVAPRLPAALFVFLPVDQPRDQLRADLMLELRGDRECASLGYVQ